MNKIQHVDSIVDRKFRNTINLMIDIINSQGEMLISSEVLTVWLEENKFKAKSAVQNKSDLPSNAELNEIRGVFSENAIYVYDGEAWVQIAKINLEELQTLEASMNKSLSDMNILKEEFSTEVENAKSLSTKIAQSEKLAKLNGYVDYGDIVLPTMINTKLPFELYRDVDGKIKHDFKVEDLRRGTNIYVDENTGLTANNGLTTSTPVRSLGEAFNIAEAHSNTSFIINIMSPIISRNYSPATRDLTKHYFIQPYNQNKVYIANSEYSTSLTWTKQTNAYKATRTATSRVVDYKFKDRYGNALEYKKLSSVAEVEANKGSWYTDGTDVYVHRLDSSEPTKEVLVLVPSSRVDWTIKDRDLIFKDIEFLKVNFDNQSNNGVRITGLGNGRVFMVNCTSRFGSTNGIQLVDTKESYLFNCMTYENLSDGFNYQGRQDTFAFEYDCTAFNCGTSSGNGTYNASTAHRGMTIVRVGTLGFDCYGPLLADVNGCTSINYDVKMSNALAGSELTKSAFWFDEAGATREGEAYLINCSGGGKDTWAINSDGNVPIYVKNFNGNNIPENQEILFLN